MENEQLKEVPEVTKLLLDRVKKLEVRNKVMSGAFIVLVISIGWIFLTGATKVPDEITAKSFRVVDDYGKTRAALYLLPDGSPWLALYDEKEKGRAALYLLPDGSPALALHDKNEKLRAALHVLPDGNIGLGLGDKNGKVRAALHVLPDGSPGLKLLDKNGRVLFSAP